MSNGLYLEIRMICVEVNKKTNNYLIYLNITFADSSRLASHQAHSACRLDLH